MTRRVGLPLDIIQRIRRSKKVPLDINIIWAATEDAIEFLESVIDSEIPYGRGWRKEFPEKAKEIDRYRETLKLYKRLYREAIKEGNSRNWRYSRNGR